MKIIALIFFSLFLNEADAQQAFSATGGEASGTGGASSYTVGQVVYTTKSDSTGTLNEGVQQTFIIEEVDGIDEQLLGLEIVLFPNPSVGLVNLQIDDILTSPLSFKLTDISGKIIIEQKVSQTNTSINLEQYSAGTYFVKVLDKEGLSRTFKIVKQ